MPITTKASEVQVPREKTASFRRNIHHQGKRKKKRRAFLRISSVQRVEKENVRKKKLPSINQKEGKRKEKRQTHKTTTQPKYTSSKNKKRKRRGRSVLGCGI